MSKMNEDRKNDWNPEFVVNENINWKKSAKIRTTLYLYYNFYKNNKSNKNVFIRIQKCLMNWLN